MAAGETMAEARQTLKIFISYARRDAGAFAEELLHGLEVAGFEAFLDRHDIAAAEDWEARLDGLIQSADTVVFVVSPAAVASERCAWEVKRAEALSKRVIPVVAVDVPEAQTPDGLKRLNYIFFTEGHSFTRALSELAKALRIDITWIREHTRLGELAKRWRERDHSSVLLLRGTELDGARAWLGGWKSGEPEPTDLHRAFITESEKAEGALFELERERLRQQGRLQRRVGIAVLVALIVTAIGGWGVVTGQRNLARSQSLMLSLGAGQFYSRNDPVPGMRLAILAAKDSFISPAAPEAADALASNAAGSGRWHSELRGHQGAVQGAVFSQDDSRILTWSKDGTAHLWESETGAEKGPALKHDAEIKGAMFSNDEASILTWSADRTARLWDAASGAQIGPALTHDGTVNGAVLSKDKARILTWGDSAARLWNAAAGKEIGSPLNHGHWVYGAVFSKDETLILTWSQDGTARLWKTSAGAQIGPPLQHDGSVNGALFSRDEAVILTWSDDGTARLWKAAAGAQIGAPLAHDDPVNGHMLPLAGAMFSNDETRILTWGGDGTWRLWNARTGGHIVTGRHAVAITGAALSRDESRVLTWSESGAQLWNARTGDPIGALLKHNYQNNGVVGQSVKSAVFSADESRILTWSTDGARIWNTATGAQIGPLLTHERGINGALFSHGDSRVLTWSEDNTARQFDVSWTIRRSSNASFVKEVCDKALPEHLQTIDAVDIEAVPILRGREGEDVCASPTFLDWLRGIFKFGD